MKVGQLINVTEKRNLINTSESYSADCFLLNDQLLFPVINLDLIGDVIDNPTRIRIDYTYIVLAGVSQIEWIGEKENLEISGQLKVDTDQIFQITDWFGFKKQDQGYELKIKYKDLLLYVPLNAKSGQNWWTPWDTPNFNKNLTNQDLVDFENLVWFPKEILQDLDRHGDRHKIEFKQGTEEQVKTIHEKWAYK
jgi:hypothetical protein